MRQGRYFCCCWTTKAPELGEEGTTAVPCSLVFGPAVKLSQVFVWVRCWITSTAAFSLRPSRRTQQFCSRHREWRHIYRYSRPHSDALYSSGSVYTRPETTSPVYASTWWSANKSRISIWHCMQAQYLEIGPETKPVLEIRDRRVKPYIGSCPKSVRHAAVQLYSLICS